jgi:hypothetical protein
MLPRKWVHMIAWGWVTLLQGRLRDFVVAPSSVGGASALEMRLKSTEERASSGHHHIAIMAPLACMPRLFLFQ